MREVSQLPRKFIDKRYMQGWTHLDASKYSTTNALFEQYYEAGEISKVQVFEIGHLTSMQVALSKVHDQLGQRREELATTAVFLKEDLSRLKQENGSNVKHVPGDKDTNIKKMNVNRKQKCEGA